MASCWLCACQPLQLKPSFLWDAAALLCLSWWWAALQQVRSGWAELTQQVGSCSGSHSSRRSSVLSPAEAAPHLPSPGSMWYSYGSDTALAPGAGFEGFLLFVENQEAEAEK